jgi:hypothetical protein
VIHAFPRSHRVTRTTLWTGLAALLVLRAANAQNEPARQLDQAQLSAVAAVDSPADELKAEPRHLGVR